MARQAKHKSRASTATFKTGIGRLVSELSIEKRSTSGLTTNPRNARTHSSRQIDQIAASIRQFGFLVPLLIDEAGMILAGHGRLEAAKRLGLSDVPVMIASHLTAARKRAFVLADNRLAELAGWDEDILRIELEELSAVALDFEIEITGFSTIDIDRLTSTDTAAKADPDDEVEPVREDVPPITRLGDLWILGDHKLLCSDAMDPESWIKLLAREKAAIAFTDPPYNVKIDGHVSGLGHVKHREFAMASGEMTSEEFTDFLERVIGHMVHHSRDGAIHYLCMDWRHQTELLDAALPQYGTYKNLCVWNKTNAGMGTFYRSQHELVHVFKVGKGEHVNNFGLGETGRYRTNVWTYAGVNTFRRGRDEDLAQHPTVKPVLLVADALRDCSKRGDLVIDPFGGSGTTLIAAERTHRKARLIELDPLYVDSTIRRWQKRTGRSAVLAATGESFEVVSSARAREVESNVPHKASTTTIPRRRASVRS